MKRAAVLLLIFAGSACTQTRPAASAAEVSVTAAYRQLEKADRDGDGDLWLRLHDRATLAQMDEAGMNSMRAAIKARGPDPGLRYQPAVVRAAGNNAVVIGSITGSKGPGGTRYHSVRYAMEDGEWKIAEEVSSNVALDPRAVFGLVPPADGAFLRAGSPWKTVSYAGLNTAYFRPEQLPWKMQAAQDDAFLYVRFESASPLAAPGFEIEKSTLPPEGPQVIKILPAVGPSFEFRAGPIIETRFKYNQATKKNDNRYFMQYSLDVSHATRGVQTGDTIFRVSSDGRFGHLVTVQDRYLDVRIPLEALGLDPARRTPISLEEFNSVPKILPYRVIPKP
jgi:hypothetical protein